MIGFSQREIFLSVLYALIYGVAYALFYSILSVFNSAIKCLPATLPQIFKFEKVLPLPKIKFDNERENGKIIAFLSVITFSLGFVLLSYFALDGQVRIYMLILSFASFYVSNFAFWGIFVRVASIALNLAFLPLSLSLRLIVFLRKKKQSKKIYRKKN